MNATATTTATTWDESSVVRNGNGRFGVKGMRDAVNVTLQPGDQFGPILEEDAREMVEDLFKTIDSAWADERKADELRGVDENRWLIADGEAAGKAHSAAVAIACLITDEAGDLDYEAIGENLLDSRRQGQDLEELDGWTGPGDISAEKRARVVQWMRDRADLIGSIADQDLPADAIAYQQSRSMALSDAADTIAGVGL